MSPQLGPGTPNLDLIEAGPGTGLGWTCSAFAEVGTAEQYLDRLESLVGWPLPVAPAATPLPPLALPEALDHLDAHWRLRTGTRLLTARRLEAVATLALPVTSASELQTAHSALTDLLGGLNPGGPPARRAGSLNHLEERLASVIDDDNPPNALSAVLTLRQLVQLRVARQHSGSQAFRRALDARPRARAATRPGQPQH